jgi:hypothetical protein
MKFLVFLFLICSSVNLIAGTMPAASNKPLDITFDSKYLEKIGFDKLYYFLNENTIKIAPGYITNKTPALEWSPNGRYLLLYDIQFGGKPPSLVAAKVYDYQFLIIDAKTHTLKPYKLPVYGWGGNTNLIWFSDSELAIPGRVEGGRLNVEYGIDNVVVFDLKTRVFKNWKLPDFNEQDNIGCLDFVDQWFFNPYTKQIFVKFNDSQACGAREATAVFNPDKSGEYNASVLNDDRLEFNGIALVDGTILNGKYVSTSGFKMKPTKYSLVYHYCDRFDGCAFNKDMQYASIQRDNTIRLGKYSYPPPQASSYTLETSGYIIKLQSDCKNGKMSCNKFTYYGKSKRNGNSITLHGTRTKYPCYDKVCKGRDFVFKKGDYVYWITALGHLTVTKTIMLDKNRAKYESVVDEDGKWE